MMQTYETPDLTIHGSISMLTMDEGGEEDHSDGGGHEGCNENPPTGGDAKPDKPEWDAFCLFSHSPGAES